MALNPMTHRIPVEKLRWRMNPDELSFESTETLEPLTEIIGQHRGVEAFRFGARIEKSGYNIFVTGTSGSGRLATVKALLAEISRSDQVPGDICYVSNFNDPESPLLLTLPARDGAAFKKEVRLLVGRLRREIPQLFDSQEYIGMKKELTESFERKASEAFKSMARKAKEEGFAMVDVQTGPYKRPDVMPLVEGKPVPLAKLDALVENGSLTAEQLAAIVKTHAQLKEEVDRILLEVRDLQREVSETLEKMDRNAFLKTAQELVSPLKAHFPQQAVQQFLQSMFEDMADNLSIFTPPEGGSKQLHLQGPAVDTDAFQPYEVNLLVDNGGLKRPPIVVEEFPTYRNIFGSIERIVDRNGVWRTDFSKIKSGSLIKANGGFLVLNLRDAIPEPGVWQGLKRALKSKKVEIQTFDLSYGVTTAGLKPEPIPLNVKVVVIADPLLYQSLLFSDEDLPKIFKVRADFDIVMDRSEKTIAQFARFVRKITDEEALRPFDRTAVAALVEQSVRMAGRQEKLSTSFPALTDIMRESDHWAGQAEAPCVTEAFVDQALAARRYRSNLIEERIQEMIDRGTIRIDVEGTTVGQVNGLAVYSIGDYTFGKPSRITASTAMGDAGVINIEREADLSGSTHNKGVLILSGYLRKKFAQDKPLVVSASLAFEQSYSGVDGDSASSTEVYALLSSLAGVPLRQDIAVTGSVSQDGRVQAIGGVNQKIEGFFNCCRQKGLTGSQGVMIPTANVVDLMLRKEVVAAVSEGHFHVYAVDTIDQGIEILSGTPAGEKSARGAYPSGSINRRVDDRLTEWAEAFKQYGAAVKGAEKQGEN